MTEDEREIDLKLAEAQDEITKLQEENIRFRIVLSEILRVSALSLACDHVAPSKGH